MVSRHSFTVHKGGKGKPEEPEDEVEESTEVVSSDGKTVRVLAKGPLGKVWCDVTLNHTGPLPTIVSDTGVWIKTEGDDEFLVMRNQRVGPGARGYDRGPGNVTSSARELQGTAVAVGSFVDCIEFVKSYLRFLYEEVKLGRAENWK